MGNYLKLLIAEDCEEFNQRGISEFERVGFEVKLVARDGSDVLESIQEYRPDIVLMDLCMTNVDAIDVIRSVKNSNTKQPIFIILSSFSNPMLEREILAAGASHYVAKPFDVKELAKKIASLTMSTASIGIGANISPVISTRPGEPTIECKVTDILHQIGVPAHIKGYHYLRDSIIMSVENPDIINAVTKQLYPSVARRFSTTPSRVERAIRHAIEVAWDRGDVDILNSYFGYTIHNSRGKPTNSEFIAMISDKLRLQIKSAS